MVAEIVRFARVIVAALGVMTSGVLALLLAFGLSFWALYAIGLIERPPGEGWDTNPSGLAWIAALMLIALYYTGMAQFGDGLEAKIREESASAKRLTVGAMDWASEALPSLLAYGIIGWLLASLI